MWAAEDKSPGTADQNGRFELKNVSTVLIEQRGWSHNDYIKKSLTIAIEYYIGNAWDPFIEWMSRLRKKVC
jgi:hypothetical protein